MTASRFGLAVLGGLAMTVVAAAPLEGSWGGDRLRLAVDTAGATIETDCADGRITGPIVLTPQGTFAAAGSFNERRGGPQPADVGAQSSAARFTGEVKGDAMTLTILPAGASAPLRFELRKGAKVKLVRCH